MHAPSDKSWFWRNLRFISTIGVFATLTGGFTMIGVDEYAAAIIFWGLAAAVSIAQAIYWHGANRKRTIGFRCLWLIGSACAFILFGVWTLDRKSTQAWTNLRWFRNDSALVSDEPSHPELRITGLRGPMTSQDYPGLILWNLEFQNTGKVSATGFRRHYNVSLQPGALSAEQEDQLFGSLLDELDKVERGTSEIQPNEMLYFSPRRNEFSVEENERFKRGELFVYLMTVIQYQDSKELHETVRCLFFVRQFQNPNVCKGWNHVR